MMDQQRGAVIELLDDSSDDDQKQPARASNYPITIDLCDDDSDDLERKPSPKRKSAAKLPAYRSEASSGHASASLELNSTSIPETMVGAASRRVTYPKSERKQQSYSLPANEPISLLDDTGDEADDDDDDSILNDTSLGLKRKRVASVSESKQAPPVRADRISMQNPYVSQSPQSLYEPKTLPRQQPKQPPQNTPLTSLQSPYAATFPSNHRANNPTRHACATNRPFPYPERLTQHAKQYSDIRAQCMLAFWKYGRQMTARAHERSKLDIVGKRVVKLALSTFPIRSIEELSLQTTHHGSVESQKHHREAFTKELHEGRLDSWKISVGHPGSITFYSITEACLVALARVVGSEENLGSKNHWLPLPDLIAEIDKLLHPCVPGKLTRSQDDDKGASYYMKSSTRSLEFLQVKKLEVSACGGPFIKPHTVKGTIHYELLADGLDMARKMRTRRFPAPDGFYRCSRIESFNDVVEDYRQICLGVDLREGGGGSRTLHRMCDTLDKMHVPFFVASLDIGDYVFFTRIAPEGPMNLLCPLLVERKSIQDVAMSMYDGRWIQQKKRMYKGQYVFGYDNCRMVYIIEGNMNKQTVSGEYVGNRWQNIKTDGVDEEIKNLKAEGFDVLRTTSVENSMMQLARWTQRVAKEVQNGSLKVKYTYEEFKKCVNRIPRATDFSKIARDYAASQLAAEEAAEAKAEGNSPPGAKRQRTAETRGAEDMYLGWKKSELEAECQKVGLPKTGRHKDLVQRLLGPHPPEIWLLRKRRNQHVPERHNVCGTALLVALYLHENEVGKAAPGLKKDDLYCKAEGLNISKNPFSGGTTQTGPYHYDGWASMSKLLQGDPALVTKVKGSYKLTRSCDIAGFPVAKAMHRWCHQHNNCPCGAAESEL